MKQFLKIVLGTIVGLILFNAFLFFLFIGIAASAGSSDKVVIKENSILHLKLNNLVRERGKEDPLANLLNGGKSSSDGLDDLLEAIGQAKKDPKIKGIFLDLSYTMMGASTREDVRGALVDFKKSGKFIYSYAEYMSESAYYLASVADKIYLNPSGEVEFNGSYANITFFKGALEKLEVKPEIFRVGDFKSAVEPFMLDKMSDANRLQTKTLLEGIENHFYAQIAASRNMPLDTLKAISHNMKVQSAKLAAQYKLVDKLAYYDEVADSLKSRAGLKTDDKLRLVTVSKYLKGDFEAPEDEEKSSSEGRIAIIFGSGEIVGREAEGDDQIGSDEICEAIRKAREDKKVKAIVLRINSPGGSALASDVMWREIQLTKGKKPIIASMSDVAASGGYYMAMGCDTIVANPSTITGSIGVFGLFFNTQDLMNHKLGITFDGVSTGKFSALGDPNRTMTDEERGIIQRGVNDIYEDFTSKAAQGRRMNQDSLKKVASGRVWSGLDAKRIGLVDVLGNLDTALAIAARKAGLKKGGYEVKYYPSQKTLLEQITSSLSEGTADAMMRARLGEYYPLVQQMQRFRQMRGVQARLPYDLKLD